MSHIKPFRTPEEVAQHKINMKVEREVAAARAHAARQKAEKRHRYVSWANDKAILKFYRLAQRLTMETGVPHEVDHIVPLLGRTVSGLHVENNLQVLERRVNRAKSNSFEPWTEMVGGESVELPTYAV